MANTISNVAQVRCWLKGKRVPREMLKRATTLAELFDEIDHLPEEKMCPVRQDSSGQSGFHTIWFETDLNSLDDVE